MKGKLWVLCMLMVWLGACSVPKDVAYFQGVDDLTPEQVSKMSQSYSTKICPDDLLTITVTGWDPTVLTPFNPPTYSYSTLDEEKKTTTNSADDLQTYLVYKDGSINFPILGKVQAAGLSKQELAESLRVQIEKYAKDINVNVQIVNFKITVMGDVVRPGVVSIKNDRVSILDVLGSVGDLTINANRKNILVIRDKDGKKEFGRIDMTDPALFTSPYYYLRQNDVVYVEPNDVRARQSTVNGNNVRYTSFWISLSSLFTSVAVLIFK